MTTPTREECAAAIDLGTNTALLLVARLHRNGTLEVVEDHCRTPRLGAGVAERGALDPAAVERTLGVLAFFADRLRALAVPEARTRAVGTAVLRRAADARAFVALVRERTGLSLEILSEEEEAHLGHLAVSAEGADARTVVIDVGGGSTEIACAELGLACSVPIGAVVMTESFLGERALRPGGFPALCAAAREACRAFPEAIARSRPVVALGGTGVNLACLARGFERFDHARAEGSVVAAPLAGQFADALARLSLEDRRREPIEPERAEILPAGLACLAAALERVDASELLITGRGLRFGVVRTLLAS